MTNERFVTKVIDVECPPKGDQLWSKKYHFGGKIPRFQILGHTSTQIFPIFWGSVGQFLPRFPYFSTLSVTVPFFVRFKVTVIVLTFFWWWSRWQKNEPKGILAAPVEYAKRNGAINGQLKSTVKTVGDIYKGWGSYPRGGNNYWVLFPVMWSFWHFLMVIALTKDDPAGKSFGKKRIFCEYNIFLRLAH